MEEIMTDGQFEKILKMVAMILDGCQNLEEAKQKVAELIDGRKEKPEQAREEERAADLPKPPDP